MIWSQHHILTDGWSLPIILKDVFHAYEEIKKGREISLRSPRPYRNYIAWLQKQDTQKAEIFWKETLFSLEGPTHLSFKDIITKNKEKDYNVYIEDLSIEETEKLKAFAKQNNLTLSTLIQGAIGLVLKTYTQLQDIVLGITVSGRDKISRALKKWWAFLLILIPLRITFQKGETLLSFLKNLQNYTQTINKYAYAPLAQIQSWTTINKNSI